MLHLPSALRIFVCLEPVDMRKGFDRLAALVQEALSEDPLSGALFVFHSRRRDRVKLLYWDGDGYAMWYKRLEKGSFTFPVATSSSASPPSRKLQMRASDLMMLLDGVDLRSVRRQTRFSLDDRRSSDS